MNHFVFCHSCLSSPVSHHFRFFIYLIFHHHQCWLALNFVQTFMVSWWCIQITLVDLSQPWSYHNYDGFNDLIFSLRLKTCKTNYIPIICTLWCLLAKFNMQVKFEMGNTYILYVWMAFKSSREIKLWHKRAAVKPWIKMVHFLCKACCVSSSYSTGGKGRGLKRCSNRACGLTRTPHFAFSTSTGLKHRSQQSFAVCWQTCDLRKLLYFKGPLWFLFFIEKHLSCRKRRKIKNVGFSTAVSLHSFSGWKRRWWNRKVKQTFESTNKDTWEKLNFKPQS